MVKLKRHLLPSQWFSALATHEELFKIYLSGPYPDLLKPSPGGEFALARF